MRDALPGASFIGFTGTPIEKAEKALEVLLEKLDVLHGLFHGFDYGKFEGTPAEALALLPAAANHILGLGDKNEINGKTRFLDAMAANVTRGAHSACARTGAAINPFRFTILLIRV